MNHFEPIKLFKMTGEENPSQEHTLNTLTKQHFLGWGHVLLLFFPLNSTNFNPLLRAEHLVFSFLFLDTKAYS